jgi:hypothetical protein
MPCLSCVQCKVTSYSVCTMVVQIASDNFGMATIVFSHPICFVLLHSAYECRLDSVESRASGSMHMAGLVLSRRRGHTIPIVVSVRLPTIGINASYLLRCA